MATGEDAAKEMAARLDLVKRLLEAGKVDSVYRDVYRERAVELAQPVLPRAAWDALKGARAQYERLLEETRRAVERRDWERVQELTGRAEGLKADLAAHTAELPVGEALYDDDTPSFDLFSPGFDVVAEQRGEKLVELRSTLVRQLEALEQGDAARAAFYASRRQYFAGLSISDPRAATAEARVNPAELEREAARAAQRNDLTRLQAITGELLKLRTAAAPGQPSRDLADYACPVDLATSLPEAAVRGAAGLGLAPASLPQPPDEVAGLAEFMHRNAWNPRFRDEASLQDGAARLRAAIESAALPAEAAALVQEFIELFMRLAYVNSGGARYLPVIRAESLLVEDFPEVADPPATSPLLTALGLPRRRALSRIQIEHALATHGTRILREEIGLDPLDWRLVCIPYDAYVRLGPARGWGKQPYWTHFDGYQVMQGLRLRALVGGSGRFGGVVDIVSISRDDEREGVVARFAVVRRARQVARWR